MKKCADLFEMDYKIKILHNDKGTYCSNYPPQLILIDSELHSDVPRTAAQDTVGNVQRFRQLISGCHFARCRSRFPMPVLLVQGKYICRSATLSGAKEVYGSRLLWYGGGGDAEDEDGDVMSYELTEQVRKKDIKLLQAMDVNIIVDLMVENKKVKYGLK